MKLKYDHRFSLIGPWIYFCGNTSWSSNNIPRATFKIIRKIQTVHIIVKREVQLFIRERPGSKFHLTYLLIKWKELYIYSTRAFVNGGRYPIHQTVV